MKNPNIFRHGIIKGRVHRDPVTGMLNVDWSDGRREVYMTISALRAAGVTVSANSKYARPERRYRRQGNVLHLLPIRRIQTLYGNKSNDCC